ncbi:MAG: T9SS type A sorting domain-containing protein [Bacteroidetes bacterium]|nr:T9SS type A sorting domain-containing protein [Bacteroidota bacterium]
MKGALLTISLVIQLAVFAQDNPFEVAEKCGYTQRVLPERRSDAPLLDIVYQKLVLDPNPATGYLKGKSVIVYTPKETTSEIILELHRALSIDSILRNGNNIIVQRTLDLIKINLATPLLPGDLDTIEVYYSGQPSFDELYYSRSAHKSGNIVATRSEPYGCYYWFPCQNTLSDKIDSIEVTLICDSIYKGVSNGRLIDVVSLDSGRSYYHWKHTYPITPYLIAISISSYDIITDYASVNQGQDSLKIQNFVYPFYKETATGLVKQTIPIMTLYDSLFGPYPFMREQYGHAQFHHGGGMEHQTMSFMGSFSFDLIAHELMHQWFGDKITCGSWQDLWLNEGFATYGNMLCYKYLKNDSLWMLQLQKAIDEVTKRDDGSVYARDTSSMSTLFNQRLVYMKGAMAIHMLRFVCGDDAFFKGIRNYLSDSNLAYGFALQKDLKWHLEQESGKNLSHFFNQWIMGEGFPTFTIHYAQSSNKTVNISVFQETSHSSVSFFDIPIPLRFVGKNGEIADKIIYPDSTFFNTKVTVPFTVDKVLFDPDKWLLARALVIKDKGDDIHGILLYPNPNKGLLNIVSSNDDIMTYKIISADGKVVANKVFTDSLKKGEILSIDISELAAGFYIFESTGIMGKQAARFIKQ